MEPTSNGIKVWQWVVTVIVIIILVLVGYKIFSKSSSNNTAEETNTEATTTESNTASKDLNRVMVSDQFPGNIVYISSVTLAKSGFVVIQSDNKGVPGDVIGYQYFDKGTNPGKITLNSSTKEGGLYYAVLYETF
jgi:Ca2+/Na+ antiporter